MFKRLSLITVLIILALGIIFIALNILDIDEDYRLLCFQGNHPAHYGGDSSDNRQNFFYMLRAEHLIHDGVFCFPAAFTAEAPGFALGVRIVKPDKEGDEQGQNAGFHNNISTDTPAPRLHK